MCSSLQKLRPPLPSPSSSGNMNKIHQQNQSPFKTPSSSPNTFPPPRPPPPPPPPPLLLLLLKLTFSRDGLDSKIFKHLFQFQLLPIRSSHENNTKIKHNISPKPIFTNQYSKPKHKI